MVDTLDFTVSEHWAPLPKEETFIAVWLISISYFSRICAIEINEWMDYLAPYFKVRAKICVNNPKAYIFLVLIHTRMFARVVPNS